MSKLPKLRIKYPFGYPSETICELEEADYRFRHGDEVQIGSQGQAAQAKYRFSYGDDALVMVEGHLVRSYKELVQLASRDEYKDKEMLEVELLAMGIAGG